jgi:hypothetical protein
VASTTSDWPFCENIPPGFVATVLTVVGFEMFVMDAVVGVTAVTAAPVCGLTLFTTLTDCAFTPVTHVSAEAEDKSAALMLPTPIMSRRRRVLLPLLAPIIRRFGGVTSSRIVKTAPPVKKANRCRHRTLRIMAPPRERSATEVRAILTVH